MIEIIPAIDLIDGKAVRLSQGDFARKTIYHENPLVVAKEFEAIGVKRLHVVDLDGARNGRITNLPVLESIAAETNLTIDFGGGIKSLKDAQDVLNAGGKMIGVGSMAVKSPGVFEDLIEKIGAENILLGADVKNGKIAVNGWQTETGIELIEFLENWFAKGVRQVFCTDISRDGLLQGAATELYRKIHNQFPKLNLIASGGVSSVSDFDSLEKAGCRGVIVGKAIYEGRISLSDLQSFLQRNRD